MTVSARLQSELLASWPWPATMQRFRLGPGIATNLDSSRFANVWLQEAYRDPQDPNRKSIFGLQVDIVSRHAGTIFGQTFVFEDYLKNVEGVTSIANAGPRAAYRLGEGEPGAGLAWIMHEPATLKPFLTGVATWIDFWREPETAFNVFSDGVPVSPGGIWSELQVKTIFGPDQIVSRIRKMTGDELYEAGYSGLEKKTLLGTGSIIRLEMADGSLIVPDVDDRDGEERPLLNVLTPSPSHEYYPLVPQEDEDGG